MQEHINESSEVSQHIIAGDKYFPNNSQLPVLVYKQVFKVDEGDPAKTIEDHFKANDWSNSWVEGVYTYHHYHSNTHEVLGIASGNIMLVLGGDDGSITTLSKGDVILIPAGVAHKNAGASDDFKCVGAYPGGKEYDMNFGKPGEREAADENISKVSIPTTDPVFGTKGPVFEHWKKDGSPKVLDTAAQF